MPWRDACVASVNGETGYLRSIPDYPPEVAFGKAWICLKKDAVDLSDWVGSMTTTGDLLSFLLMQESMIAKAVIWRTPSENVYDLVCYK